jgi:hypothetical protein
MTPRRAHSSQEHGVPRQEQLHVLLHATCTRELRVSDPDRERITLFFHAMPLGPKYRRLREEQPDG